MALYLVFILFVVHCRHIPFGNGILFRATGICQNQYYTTYNNEMTLKLLNPRHQEASLDFIYCHQYLTLLNTSASKSFEGAVNNRILKYIVATKYCFVGIGFREGYSTSHAISEKQLVQTNSARSQQRTLDDSRSTSLSILMIFLGNCFNKMFVFFSFLTTSVSSLSIVIQAPLLKN